MYLKGQFHNPRAEKGRGGRLPGGGGLTFESSFKLEKNALQSFIYCKSYTMREKKLYNLLWGHVLNPQKCKNVI